MHKPYAVNVASNIHVHVYTCTCVHYVHVHYYILTFRYAMIHIPIIASVSEHQPTTWTSFFFDLHVHVY